MDGYLTALVNIGPALKEGANLSFPNRPYSTAEDAEELRSAKDNHAGPS